MAFVSAQSCTSSSGSSWCSFSIVVQEQDVNREDRGLRRRLQNACRPGIILYVFVMSFAAIDWVMSISPHWASTIMDLFVAASSFLRWP